MPTVQITTAARRMCRTVNSDQVVPGYIYAVKLATGRLGGVVATYAIDQVKPGDRNYGKEAFYRISHGRTTQAQCQRFLDAKGEGF